MLKPSSERGAWDGSRSWDMNPLPQHTGQPLDRQQQGTGLSQFSIDAAVEHITENEQAFERSFSFRKYMETKCSRAELDTYVYCWKKAAGRGRRMASPSPQRSDTFVA